MADSGREERPGTPSSDDNHDDYEEAEGGKHFLGFMFGNVDDSGDLDADYLDEDAKEHLFALANELGPSLTDIKLSRSSPSSRDSSEKIDYNEKDENAVDYEDINEEYDGPEVEASYEEDHFLPKKDYSVSISDLESKGAIFDEENYDEDEEIPEDISMPDETTAHEIIQQTQIVDKKNDDVGFTNVINTDDWRHTDILATGNRVCKVEKENSDEDDVILEGKSTVANTEHQYGSQSPVVTKVDYTVKEESLSNIGTTEATIEPSVLSDDQLVLGSQEDAYTELSDHLCLSPMGEYDGFESEDFQTDDAVGQGVDHKKQTALPVLCLEDGNVILRFSEIFGIHEPIKKAKKYPGKYSLTKGRKVINPAHMTEEDEALFLRRPGIDLSKHLRIYCGDFQADMDQSASAVTSQMNDIFLSSQPMKDAMPGDTHASKHSAVCPELYPLEHANWENEIIWGNSPTKNSDFLETSVMPQSEVETDEALVVDQSRMTMPSDEQFRLLGCPMEANVQYIASCPVIMRAESFEMNNNAYNNFVTEEGNASSGILQRYSALSTLNRQLMDGSWLDSVIWDMGENTADPKLVLDLRDAQMLFEVLDDKSNEHIITHASAMMITRSAKSSKIVKFGHQNHRNISADLFNISNDQFYSNRKTSQQVKSQAKKRTSLGVKVVHSTPALKLQTMKIKLSNKEIANFHRPKALWYPRDNVVASKFQGDASNLGHMRVVLMTLGGKGVKLQVYAEEILSNVKLKAAKKLDFKLSESFKLYYNGRELDDEKSLAMQNVRPNSVLYVLCTRIHLWPRAQRLPGENKPLRPPGAFKKKSDLSVKDGHVFLMEYWEERPLLIGNVGMGARLCTYYQKVSPGDQKASSLLSGSNGVGTVVALEPSDKSPFLGEIGSGCSQPSLETNMYRAPVFSHKVASSDYLLVRSAKGILSLRRIDKLCVVGQQEPHMEVFPPGTKNVQNYLVNRMLVYVYREFRTKERPGLIPKLRADELSAQFPNLTDAIVRKRLKHCAELRKGPHGQFFWVQRRDFRIPSEEELRRLLTPEHVCCYESMQASWRRLKCLGIQRLTHPVGLSSAMNQLPDEAITLAAASHIERELQITAWNLTSNFVSCTSQDRENIERLEIKGIGDPSGRGHGFSYVRVAPKAPAPGSVKKKSAAAKGTTVTGTDADLRRLSMETAREVLLKFDVPEEQIEKLTRWHRIALVRKLSSEHAASGMMIDTVPVSKFARGQRMSFMQLQQQAREKCQEIWDRQVQSLTCAEDEEDSESEANSDLDSFAGDLEHLLDAEDLEDVNADNLDTRVENINGMKGGIKMRKSASQYRTEEEIEDDEAQAAYVLSILEEDDNDSQRKNLNGVASFPSHLYKEDSRASQQIRMPLGLGAFTSMEISTRDSKEVPSPNDVILLKKKAGIMGNNGFKAPFKRQGVRDSLVCGACGQVGHMRTNKNCPKYGEDLEILELESVPTKPNIADMTSQLPTSSANKKLVTKITAKLPDVEISDVEKAKFLPVKFKLGGPEKLLDRNLSGTVALERNSAELNSEVASAGKPTKILLPSKRPEDLPQETPKHAIVIRPPVEVEKSQPRKKIVIRQPKVVVNSYEQNAYIDIESDQDSRLKVRRISDIASLDNRDDGPWYTGETSQKSSSYDARAWAEENSSRYKSRAEEERYWMEVEEENGLLDEHQGWYESRGFEEASKEKAKKKKKKKIDFQPDYLIDHKPYRNDRKMPVRDRAAKRRSVADIAEYAPSTKRRRGGEVELSNILEKIVDILRSQTDIAYLFLKPVTKKEAPDYFFFIKQPMDLSTIREKVRKLEYKNREQFRHDVWQIAFNAHRYNDTRNPKIPPLADQLLEICDYHLHLQDLALTNAEQGIEDLR